MHSRFAVDRVRAGPHAHAALQESRPGDGHCAKLALGIRMTALHSPVAVAGSQRLPRSGLISYASVTGERSSTFLSRPDAERAAGARRLNIKSLEFVPYGLTVDGSAARAAYAQHLQGYLAATLLPLFDAWQGELPQHLHKVRRCMPAGKTLTGLAAAVWRLAGRAARAPTEGAALHSGLNP